MPTTPHRTLTLNITLTLDLPDDRPAGPYVAAAIARMSYLPEVYRGSGLRGAPFEFNRLELARGVHDDSVRGRAVFDYETSFATPEAAP